MGTIIYETGTAITGPLVKLTESSIETIPGLVAALAILVVGYVVALSIGFVVKKGLSKLGVVKKYVQKTSLKNVVGKFDVAEFLGVMVKWYIFILFLSPAAELIKLKGLSDFLQKVSLWVPNLIIAIVIAIFGFLGAEYVEMKLKQTKGNVSSFVAKGSKIIIVIFVAIIALQQVGIDVSVAESSFLLVLAGFMLAFGIAFGLGGKEEAKAALSKFKKSL